MTENKKPEPPEFISEGNRLDRLEQQQKPEPPEFISELDQIAIRENGSVLDAFTGRTITREDLEAYNAKAAEKK